MQGVSVEDLKSKKETISNKRELKITRGWKPSIIIVGNSPDIVNYNVGSKIDKFNIVIRVNDYKIKGYTKFVGNKTSIWCTNLSKQMISILEKDMSQKNISKWRDIKQIHDVAEVWYRCWPAEYDELRGAHHKYLWGIDCLEKRIIFGSYPFYKVKFDNKEIEVDNLLNTGMCAVLQAIYDLNTSVTIHGFSFNFQKKQHHYYGNQSEEYNFEALKHEIEVLKFLKQNKLINFLVEEEDIFLKEDNIDG